MKYLIPIGGYALKTEFPIKNEYGETVLKVESNKYSLRNRISIRDQYAIEIGYIQKRLFKAGLYYEIYHEDQLMATLTKARWFFARRYKIATATKKVYKARGDFKKLNYELRIGSRRAAEVNPELAVRSENYGIEIHHGASPYICICAALIIEAIEKVK